jgi:hypothetical protein
MFWISFIIFLFKYFGKGIDFIFVLDYYFIRRKKIKMVEKAKRKDLDLIMEETLEEIKDEKNHSGKITIGRICPERCPHCGKPIHPIEIPRRTIRFLS